MAIFWSKNLLKFFPKKIPQSQIKKSYYLFIAHHPSSKYFWKKCEKGYKYGDGGVGGIGKNTQYLWNNFFFVSACMGDDWLIQSYIFHAYIL